MGPAERADVIVDFSGVPAGTSVTLLNLGPDDPFGGGTPFFGCETTPQRRRTASSRPIRARPAR